VQLPQVLVTSRLTGKTGAPGASRSPM